MFFVVWLLRWVSDVNAVIIINAEKLVRSGCTTQLLRPQPHQTRLLLPSRPCRLQPQPNVPPSSLSPRSPPPSILPSFNHDRNYFTPSFLLPADKVTPTTYSPTTAPTLLPNAPSSPRRCRRKMHSPMSLQTISSRWGSK
jgi:hypothetical protein